MQNRKILPFNEVEKLAKIDWISFEKIAEPKVFKNAAILKDESEYIYILKCKGVFYGAKVIACNSSLTEIIYTPKQR
jgi:hypothetical protein